MGYLDRGKISHVDFLKLIEADHNIFGAETLNRFIDEGVLAFDELDNLGIDNRFIQSLAKISIHKILPFLIENLRR